jgi:hypothetical protein
VELYQDWLRSSYTVFFSLLGSVKNGAESGRANYPAIVAAQVFFWQVLPSTICPRSARSAPRPKEPLPQEHFQIAGVGVRERGVPLRVE